MSSGTLRRLTSGLNQTATPTWSPDGQWIVHQEVVSLGSGAGWTMGAVWAAAADGSAVVRLYEAEGAGEAFLGWTGPDSLVAYSWSADSPHDARLLHPDTGEVETLVAGPFDSVAMDPSSGAMAFTVSDFVARLSGQEAGLYLLSASANEEQMVSAGEWTWLA